MPGLRGAGEEECGCGELRGAAEQVRRDHHEVPWQAVCPDAAGEQEDEVRQHVGREHETEVRRGAGQDDHREGERDRRERAAEQRDRAPEEEQAKVALGKRTEREPATSCLSRRVAVIVPFLTVSGKRRCASLTWVSVPPRSVSVSVGYASVFLMSVISPRVV